jgi:hypothetical protein
MALKYYSNTIIAVRHAESVFIAKHLEIRPKLKENESFMNP